MRGHATITFGILGAGDAGGRHVRALSSIDGVSVSWIADMDQARADQLAASVAGAEALHATRAPFAAVDVVCVCTPPSEHKAAALEALAAGCNVLIEKPAVTALSDLTEIAAVSERAKLLAGAVCQHRFSESARVAAEIISRRELGSVYAASMTVRRRRSSAYYGDSWKGRRSAAGGGSLMSLGFHALDLVCMWLGKPIEAVALAHSAADSDVEACLAGALRFPDGLLLSIDVATGEGPTQPDLITLAGSAKSLRWSGDSLEVSDGRRVPRGEDLHRAQLVDYVAALRSGTPTADLRTTRPALAAIQALYRSAASGRKIEIEA